MDSQRTYLFDLEGDLSETNDLSRFRPEIADSMFNELQEYLERVGTKLPTPNPDYDPSKDGALLSLTGVN